MKSRQVARLARKLLRADRRSYAILAIAVGGALFASLLVTEVGRTVAERAASESVALHGSARITLASGGPKDGSAPPLIGAPPWITTQELGLMTTRLADEPVSLQAVIICDGVLVSGTEVRAVNVVSGTGARGEVFPRDLWLRLAAPGTPLGAESAGEIPSLFISYVDPSGPEGGSDQFLDLGAAGVTWHPDRASADTLEADHDLLLAALKRIGGAPEDAAGNAVIVRSLGDASTFVVAFNSRELLLPEFPHISVESAEELSGTNLQIAATNIPRLLTLAVTLIAIAAIIGTVLVLSETRSDQLTLLNTLGFDARILRAIFSRQVLITAFASAWIAVAAFGAAAAVPGLAFRPGAVLGSAIVAIVGPTGLAFLVARGTVRSRANQQLSEFRR